MASQTPEDQMPLDSFHQLKPAYRVFPTPRQLAESLRSRKRFKLARAVADEPDGEAILAWFDAQADERLDLVRLTAPGEQGWIDTARREIAR